MLNDLVEEARRQVQVCNACRYCEGFCSVFPAIHRERSFSAANITQLANLCHNCRGCYYACQYTDPHEFALNVPKALAEVRQASWQEFAYPRALATKFHRSGMIIVLASIVFFTLFIIVMSLAGKNPNANGFYQWLSHTAMISVFIPAFILPLVSIGYSLRAYWQAIEGQPIKWKHIKLAAQAAADMRNLKGGHGEGCNFEQTDRFSHSRRIAHQLTLYGFLLCFAATSGATVLHYVFNLPAPYPLLSFPKILGLSGGIMLCIGTTWLFWLKHQADPSLTDKSAESGAYGFIFLLFLVSATGLLLYIGGSVLGNVLLAWHLGCVLTFFLLTPYSKMAHGFYRMAALIREAQFAP